MKAKQAKLDEIDSIARWIIDESQHKVFLLEGKMGAGKTTLIKALARNLNVEDEVSSPTYALVNEYRGGEEPVFHFDFYRIHNEQEALEMGFYDYVDSGCFCFIEWPEKIRNLIPSEHCLIKISLEGSQRKYQIIQPLHE